MYFTCLFKLVKLTMDIMFFLLKLPTDTTTFASVPNSSSSALIEAPGNWLVNMRRASSFSLSELVPKMTMAMSLLSTSLNSSISRTLAAREGRIT